MSLLIWILNMEVSNLMLKIYLDINLVRMFYDSIWTWWYKWRKASHWVIRSLDFWKWLHLRVWGFEDNIVFYSNFIQSLSGDFFHMKSKEFWWNNWEIEKALGGCFHWWSINFQRMVKLRFTAKFSWWKLPWR